MANTTALPEVAQGLRKSRLPLIVGTALGLAGAAGGFFLTFSSILRPGYSQEDRPAPAALPDLAFVALEPILLSLGPGSRSRHLRFTAQIEVERRHRAEVETLKPRILDLFNGYLRAIDPAELDRASALVRLRAQMLRRLQVITGEGRVRDLLITEFVLN